MANYEVSYRISVPIGASATNITKVADAVKGLAGADTILKEVTKQLNNFSRSLERFNSAPKKIKIDETGFNKQINNIQKKLNALKKDIKVKVNPVLENNAKAVKPQTIKPVTSSLPSTIFVGSSSTSRNGRNRAARGFGNGSKGLYGLSDVLYAAGFPFPNMVGAAAIGMGLMSLTKSFAEYENLMVTVGAILKSTDGDAATFNKRLAAMAHNIRQVGIDTKFTTAEVAGAAKYLAMAGLSIQDINNSIRPIANLAIIGDAPIDRMADITTNIQTAYGLSSDKMTKIADVLTSVTNSTNTNVLEMGEAMKFAAPMMSLAHISFNEAAASIGLLANAGLKGTVAGTALRAMMVRLLNPTKKGQEVIDKYSLSLKEVNKQTGKVQVRSLADIFGQLNDKKATLEDIIKLFDKIGGNAANNIYAHLRQLPNLLARSTMSSGLAQEIANKKQDTIQGAWYKLTSQFTESGMRVYEGMAPELKGGLLELTATLSKPGTVQAIKDIVSAFFLIAKALSTIFSFVARNWQILGTLLIGRFLTKRLLGFSGGLFALGTKFIQFIGIVIRARTHLTLLAPIIAKVTGLLFGKMLGAGTIMGAGAASAAGKAVGGAVGGIGGSFMAAIGGIPTVIMAAVSALGLLIYKIWQTNKSFQNNLAAIRKATFDTDSWYLTEKERLSGTKEGTVVKNGKRYTALTDFYKEIIGDTDYGGFTGRGDDDLHKTLYAKGGQLARERSQQAMGGYLKSYFESGKQGTLLDWAKKSILQSGLSKITPTWESSAGDYNYGVHAAGGGGGFWNTVASAYNPDVTAVISKFPVFNIHHMTQANELGEKNLVEGFNQGIDSGTFDVLHSANLAGQIMNGTATSQTIKTFLGMINGSSAPSSVFSTTEALKKARDLVPSELLVKMLDKLGSQYKGVITDPLYSENGVPISSQNVSDPTGGTTGLGGGSGLSGVGNYKGQTPKQIIVNIHSLVDKVDCNFDKKDDLEKFKNKLSAVLVEVVADTEISLANDFS